MTRRRPNRAGLWSKHAAEWRDPAQICSQWRDASAVDPALLESHASLGWWALLAERRITLLVTREYEHLVMAASVRGATPRLSYLPMPHPSGLTVDRARRRVYLASTRNPNQVIAFEPAAESGARSSDARWLAPRSSAYYRGSLYLHDLAMLDAGLYGNAVGHNAVVRLQPDGTATPAWWPRCVERKGRPELGRNHIQLNSIAAGKTLRDSYFSASSTVMGRLRPGHLNYPVDRRGVIFSGRSREPICRGLTRPHSARLAGGRIWVANSGYGELGFVSHGRLEVIARLPGWTRGLCVHGDVAFVATSRVIPRYAGYAPGLDAARSRCGVHAVSLKSGRLLASLEWPYGNQVFAVEWLDGRDASGFPFNARSRRRPAEIDFFHHLVFEDRAGGS